LCRESVHGSSKGGFPKQADQQDPEHFPPFFIYHQKTLPSLKKMLLTVVKDLWVFLFQTFPEALRMLRSGYGFYGVKQRNFPFRREPCRRIVILSVDDKNSLPVT
jgi:hypothetical protein